MSHHRHDMPFGTRLTAQGGATFSLWAPQASGASLAVDSIEQAARADGDGWWVAEVAQARAGQRYRWSVATADGRRTDVPDPASRCSPDGPMAADMLVDPDGFEWDEDGWTGRPWTDAVAYELHVGTFTDEGTFSAAMGRLPQLAALGVTCVQLMPIATAPGRFGWGYDGVLPFAPLAAYGTADDLKRFVQAAHRLRLMVMLDVVYNHFGPSGNFLPLYAPAFFSQRHHNAWGDALNFDGEGSATVREFFIHNALYWVTEFRLDGLRLDAVHAMQDDSRPDILEVLSQRVRQATPGRHVHLVLENDVNDAHRLAASPQPGRFDGQWSGDFHHALHVMLTGEAEGYYGEYVQTPVEHLARTLTLGFAREGEPHLGTADRHAANPRRDATSVVPLAATVNFLQNHDQVGNRAFGERLAALVDDAPLRLATALLLLSPPVPLLMMGEEWGARTPFLYFADWTGELRDAVVAGRRREFAHFAAFADPAARERIPDPCSDETFRRCKLPWAVFENDPRARAWHARHRELLALRTADLAPRLPALSHGAHRATTRDGTLLAVDWRFTDGSALCVRANLSPTPADAAGVAGVRAVWHEVGEAEGDALGAWSARWWWQEATR